LWASLQDGENGDSLPESILASMSLVGRSFMYPWLALVVRSRHEKSVKTILESKGYRAAVPLVRCSHKRSSGSAWDSQAPLITGYVFVVFDQQNPFRIVTTPGVVQIVSFGSGPGTIPDTEIEALERIAASGLPVASCRYARIGETVELIEGPLRGVQGLVLRQGKTTRLVVGFELLQRSVAVEIEATWAVPMRQKQCHRALSSAR
jgi:transcription antitermination factor NusG